MDMSCTILKCLSQFCSASKDVFTTVKDINKHQDPSFGTEMIFHSFAYQTKFRAIKNGKSILNSFTETTKAIEKNKSINLKISGREQFATDYKLNDVSRQVFDPIRKFKLILSAFYQLWLFSSSLVLPPPPVLPAWITGVANELTHAGILFLVHSQII